MSETAETPAATARLPSGDLRLRIPESVLFRELDGEAVLLEVESGFYYGLNELGTRIWNLVVAHGSLEPVCQALLAEYDVTEERLRQDLEAFVSTLAERRLVLTE